MMTQKERLKVYKAAYRLALKDPSTNYGWCHYIIKVFNRYTEAERARFTHEASFTFFVTSATLLPEFYELRWTVAPTPYSMHWWPTTPQGWRMRLQAFRKMIRKMEYSIKHKSTTT